MPKVQVFILIGKYWIPAFAGMTEKEIPGLLQSHQVWGDKIDTTSSYCKRKMVEKRRGL
jgi:hypothetical protein